MQVPANQRKTPLAKKQIPTLLGLGILIISLVAGLMMFGEGTGVFAPRATPQTTPKNVKVTNLTDKSFTVVFYTDESTNGFVKYGTEANSLKSQATDDRDQLSGSIGNYRLHHVTVRGLTPNTNYNYVLGTASGSNFDNNGVPFAIKTLPPPTSAPPTNKTIYGTIVTESGAPAEGSIVFVSTVDVGEMSTLVKSSGSWALALSNARKKDGSGYAELTDTDSVNVIVQGVEPTKVSNFSVGINAAQPVPEVILGQVPQIQEATNEVAEEAVLNQEDLVVDVSISGDKKLASLTDLIDFADEDTSSESTTTQQGAQTLETIAEQVAAEVLDLTTVAKTDTPVLINQPIIKGKAAPNVEVKIEVHSEAVINQTVKADSTGDFVLNIIELQKILEPGNHTVTYSYTNPTTGQTITETQSFIVQATDPFAENTSPFGSGNPFPIETPTIAPTSPVASSPVEPSTRSAIVSTDSGTYTAGSVGNTIALVIGGLFFMFTGLWSWWLAQEVEAADE
ncbi:MAG: fibronectin type III domain-containing protein [Patescibacteria group bacterium]